MDLAKYGCIFFATFLTFVSAQAASVQLETDTLYLAREDVDEVAQYLSEASMFFVVQEGCHNKLCKIAIKRFAKGYAKLLNQIGVENKEQAYQTLAIVLSATEEINSEHKNSKVRDLFSDEIQFEIFQEEMAKAINKRKYRLLLHGALVVGGVILLASGVGAGYLIATSLAYGAETLFIGVVAASIAGAGVYYGVLRPVDVNFSQTRVDKELVQDVRAYLESMEQQLPDSVRTLP